MLDFSCFVVSPQLTTDFPQQRPPEAEAASARTEDRALLYRSLHRANGSLLSISLNRWGFAGVAAEHGVDGGGNYKRKQQGDGETADDGDGERL